MSVPSARFLLVALIEERTERYLLQAGAPARVLAFSGPLSAVFAQASPEGVSLTSDGPLRVNDVAVGQRALLRHGDVGALEGAELLVVSSSQAAAPPPLPFEGLLPAFRALARSALAAGGQLSVGLGERPDALCHAQLWPGQLVHAAFSTKKTLSHVLVEERLLLALSRAGLSAELDEPLYLDPAVQRLCAIAERLTEAGLPLQLVGEPGSGRRTLAARLSGKVQVVDRDEPGRGAVLPLPPLRDRPLEVTALFRAYLPKAAAALGRHAPEVGKDAEAALLAHGFPGNVPELKLLAFRAAAVCEGRVAPSALGLSPSLTSKRPFRATVRDTERDVLLEALSQTGWNVSEASRSLSLPRRTVVYRMSRLGLKRPPGVR